MTEKLEKKTDSKVWKKVWNQKSQGKMQHGNINYTKSWQETVKWRTNRKSHQWQFILIKMKTQQWLKTQKHTLPSFYRPDFTAILLNISIFFFFFKEGSLTVAALSRFGCMTARAISFWHTFNFLLMTRRSGRQEGRWEERREQNGTFFSFFLNEQMPGVTKDIRRQTHPQYIVSTPSVTCYIPCLEHFVRRETPHQCRNFLPTLFTSSFSLLPPPSHLAFFPSQSLHSTFLFSIPPLVQSFLSLFFFFIFRTAPTPTIVFHAKCQTSADAEWPFNHFKAV